MANTIKLKRGSGSDPGASDLSVGELAIRTDEGKIFTKKDDGSVAEISGGGSGITDGDKGDITVASSGTSWTIDAGAIDNANISSSAAIAVSKLANFVSNNAANRVITGSGTANTVNGNSDLLWNGSRLDIDTGGTEDCFRIGNTAGCDTALRIGSIATGADTHGVIKYDKDENWLSLLVSGESHGNGGILIANGGNVGISTANPSQKLDVVGNIAVSGTVDGVDIAARNTLFGGLTSSSGVLTNGVTATTQSAGDNSTKVATTAYTDTAISNLVDSSPGTLNTLNELAAALGDDANFSTTVTNSIATKLPLAGGTLTGALTGTSATFTGNVSTGHHLTISGTEPRLQFTDSNNNPDFTIWANAGLFQITDATNSADRFKIDSAGTVFLPAGPVYLGTADSSSGHLNAYEVMTFNLDTDNDDTNRYFAFYKDGGSGSGTELFKIEENGQATITGNLDVSSGLDVTGDITVPTSMDSTDAGGVAIQRFWTASITAGNIYKCGYWHDGEGSVNLLISVRSTTAGNSGTSTYIFQGGWRALDGTGNSDGDYHRRLMPLASGAGHGNGADKGLDSSGGWEVLINQQTSYTYGVVLHVPSGRNNKNLQITVTELNRGSNFTDQSSSAAYSSINTNSTLILPSGYNYLGTTQVKGSLSPSADSTYNLGSNGTRWAYIYGDTISGNLYGNGANITVLNASQLSSGTVAAARLDTATTQSAGNNSTKIATTAFVSTAVTNLIGGAPGALDTLNELAAAINDDSSYASTVTTALATKLPLAGGTITGSLTVNGSVVIDTANTDFVLKDSDDSPANYFQYDTSAAKLLLGTATAVIHTRSNLLPNADSTYDIGANGTRWANVYADTLYGDGSNLTGLNASQLTSGTVAAARLPQQENGTSIVGNFGQWQGHATYTDFNTEPAYWGWNYVQGNTNAPNTTSSQWYRCRLSLGSGYGKGSDSNDYSLEMALPRYSHASAGVLHIRTIENGSEGSWTTVGNNASLITTGTLPAARLPNHSASLLTSGTIPAARVPTLNQNTTGSAATLTTARTIAGVSFDGSANISLNNNAITNGAGYITSADGGNAATVDGYNTAISATANTVVVRDDAGDINGRYFEGEWFKGRGTADSALSASNIDGGGGFVVARESDGWYFHQSASAVRGLLNVADGATNVTNNNQLTNGAGYTTYTANQSLNTNSGPTFADVYVNSWLRNNDSSDGLYNTSTTQHWYSDHDDYWTVAGGGSANGIRFRDDHASTIRGYVYASNSNQVGFLDQNGSWKLYVNSTSNVICANHFIPAANNSYDLGSSSYRWNNLYVNDMHFSNHPDNPNVVDGTWGDWTLQEGEENIYMINNRSGKRYKMALQEVA